MIKWLQRLTVIRVVWSFKVSSVLCISRFPQCYVFVTLWTHHRDLGALLLKVCKVNSRSFGSWERTNQRMLLSTSFLWAAEVWSLGYWLGQWAWCSSISIHPAPTALAVTHVLSQGSFRRIFSLTSRGCWRCWCLLAPRASAECSTSVTPHCQLLCFGLGWYRRFSVEAAAFHPYCKGRKEEIMEKEDSGLMEMIPVYSLQQGRQQPTSNPPVSEKTSSWSRIVPLSVAGSGCLEMSIRKRKKQRKKTPCQHLSSFFSNLQLKESQIGAWIHFTVFNKPLMYFSSMNLSNCFLNPFILWAMSSTVWLCFVCEKGLSFLCLNLWPDRFIRRLLFLPYKKQWKMVCRPFCAIYDFI